MQATSLGLAARALDLPLTLEEAGSGESLLCGIPHGLHGSSCPLTMLADVTIASS